MTEVWSRHSAINSQNRHCLGSGCKVGHEGNMDNEER